MKAQKLLHNAARHYCLERHAHWCSEYRRLNVLGRARIGAGYSDEALNTFPRYNVLGAILTEVERLDSDSLPEYSELRELLIIAAHSADDVFTKAPKWEIAASAMADERREFEVAIRRFTPDVLAAIPELPYRRVLNSVEVSALWSRVNARWGADGSYFFPLAVRTDPTLRAFDATAFRREFPAHRIQQLLTVRPIKRIYELREYGENNYLMEVRAWEPSYDGAEGFWFDDAMDWIMYASHESSTTVGGWLADAVLTHWKDAGNHEWHQNING
jgi:hypothetical protein